MREAKRARHVGATESKTARARDVRTSRTRPARDSTETEHDANAARVSQDGQFRYRGDVVAWKAARVGSTGYEKLTSPIGDGVNASEWPIGELSANTLRERWGIGTFRVTFLRAKGVQPRGAGHHEITITRKASEPAPAPPPSVLEADPLTSLERIMRLSEAQAARQIKNEQEVRAREFALLSEVNKRERQLDRQENERRLRRLERELERARSPQKPPLGADDVVHIARRIMKKHSSSMVRADDLDGLEDAAPSFGQTLLTEFMPHIKQAVELGLAFLIDRVQKSSSGAGPQTPHPPSTRGNSAPSTRAAPADASANVAAE